MLQLYDVICFLARSEMLLLDLVQNRSGSCLTDAWEHQVVDRQFKPCFGSKTWHPLAPVFHVATCCDMCYFNLSRFVVVHGGNVKKK